MIPNNLKERFNFKFCLKTFILDILQITEKKQRNKNKQFVDEQLMGNR